MAMKTTWDEYRAREHQARERKVRRLVEEATERGISADTAERLDAAGQVALAALAGVRVPSAVTWLVVVERLREAEVGG